MKRALMALAILAQFVMSPAAQAVAFTDTVNYWPTWQSTNDPSDNSRDVIGHPDITGGTVTYNSDRSLDRISFHNAGASWADLYSSHLFINVIGGSNDNTWDYIVWGLNKAAGNYALFDISGVGLSSVKGANPLTDYLMTSSTELSVRNDHPIAVSLDLLNTRYTGNPYNITQVGTAYFDGLLGGFDTFYDFRAGDVRVGELGFILGWSVNCANDVVYEYIPAPEPGTIILLGAGLLGLGLYGRRRMQK